MYRITTEESFSSAHRLRAYKGKCEKLHGHNWRVRVSVIGGKLDSRGLLFDFTDLKKILRDILAGLDHRDLGDVPPFDALNPSAENIARYIFERVKSALKSSGLKKIAVEKISVWESEKSRADYEPLRRL